MLLKKLALELYSVREDAARDMEDTLTKVAQMGYTGVEFGGYHGMEPRKVASIMKRLGLDIIGNHVKYNLLISEPEKHIRDMVELGGRYLVGTGAMGGANAQDLCGHMLDVAEKLSAVAEKCKEYGIKLAYHNWLPEMTQLNNEYLLDIMYAHASELVLAEPDIVWVAIGGADPAEFVKKLGKRCTLVHLRQRKPLEVGGGADIDADKGILDFSSVIKAGMEGNVTDFIYEQELEPSGNAMESVKVSCKYILSL